MTSEVVDVEAAAPRSDAELLEAFLARRSHPCPACGYDSRDLRSDRCPECGGRLFLTVKQDRPVHGPFVVGLLASAREN